MKERLFNLALIDTLNFCKANNIDPSGSHLYKRPHTFQYYLINSKTGETIVTVTFHKSSVPTHTINPNYRPN